ncbi:LptF/LptG family permease [Candidatus Pelagibacter sp.]|nr:LptF/LptG family permease [Candidatus Pelagibacter sp.]
MKTYTKFLVSIFLNSIFNVFLIIFCLIFVLNLLTELEFFKDIQVSIYYPLYFSFLNTPSFVFDVFPFIFLLSTQLFFNNLFDNDQLEIFKYSGLKNSKILSIINITAFVLGIFIIFFFYNLSSNVKSLYLQLKTNYTQDDKYLAVITNNGLWIKDVINSKTLMINAAKIDKNFLVDTYISEFDQNFQIVKNIKSKRIDISKNEWIIYNPEVYEQNYKINKKMLKLNTNFNYNIIQNLFSNLSSLSLFDLWEMRKNYKKLSYSLTDIDLQLMKLVSYPLYLVLMTMLSAIIMFNTKKFNNKYTKIILGFFCSVVIYYLTNFFYVLGSTEKINLAVSIASPLLILFLINIYFVRNINAK